MEMLDPFLVPGNCHFGQRRRLLIALRGSRDRAHENIHRSCHFKDQKVLCKISRLGTFESAARFGLLSDAAPKHAGLKIRGETVLLLEFEEGRIKGTARFRHVHNRL